MVFRTRDEQVGRAALADGRELLMAAIDDRPLRPAADVQRAVDRSMVDDCCLGPSTACIVDAATDRSIPHIRLTDGNLVQLGYGARQRRIWTAETDHTSAIAEGIASDKDLTKRCCQLRRAGARRPARRQRRRAWEAAQDIGLPVVVKPSDGNHGRGVSLEPEDARGSRGGLPRGRAQGQRRDGRALHPRQRAPPAGGRRPGGRGGARRIARG